MTSPSAVQTEENLWLALANLFFLDSEPDQRDFDNMAEMLQQAGWSREYTRTVLTELIAPVSGKNLGWLIYPIIGGEWAGFDLETLIPEIKSMQQKRATRPRWHFMLQDMNSRRMLRLLEIDRLLHALPN